MGIEQLVILVLIGLISLINWIVQKSAEARARRKAEREELPDESFHSREEPTPARSVVPNKSQSPLGDAGMRHLMEALGVELPKVELNEVAQASRSFPALAEASNPVVPPRLPSLVEMAHQFENRSVPEVRLGELSQEKRVASAKVRPRPRTQKTVAPAKPIGRLLASPGGLRNGVVLSEILGPPKAFRQT